MTKDFEYKDNTINCQLTGKGKPVFLLHGFGEDRRVWENLLPLLSSEKLYILPDLPGHGRSRSKMNFSGIPDMASLAGMMIHILDQLVYTGLISPTDVLETHWIGHSMGGYIALAVAANYPEKTGGLMLFHSTAFADSVEKKEMRRKGIHFIQNYGSTVFLQQSTPTLFTENFKEQHPDFVQQWLERYNYFESETLCHYYKIMMERPDQLDTLKGRSKKTGFIIGGLDKAVPVKDSLAQCQVPKNSYIQFLTGSAHMGMIEHPKETSEFLDWFLRES